jgi:hypothetical protein
MKRTASSYNLNQRCYAAILIQMPIDTDFPKNHQVIDNKWIYTIAARELSLIDQLFTANDNVPN